MTNRLRPARAFRQNQHPDRSRWLVPVTLGVLGLLTLALILFAIGVLVGLVRF